MPNIDPDMMMGAASTAGAITTQLVNRTEDSLRRKFCDGLAGAFTGIFFGPGICDHVGLTQQNLRTAVAFAVGLAGVLISMAMIQAAKSSGFASFVARVCGQPIPPVVIPPKVTTMTFVTTEPQPQPTTAPVVNEKPEVKPEVKP